GCSASERLPPPFPGLEPESEGAAGGSEPEAGDSDTEGEDIFTGAAVVSKHQSPKITTSLLPINNGSKENGIHEEQDQEPQDLFAGSHSVAQAGVQWCGHGSLQPQPPRLK
ncbi:SNX1 isoform 12, partial [Pan troglodytes]